MIYTMTRSEAMKILEVDERATPEEVKEQFRWLVHFYHPDNKDTGDENELRKILEAYGSMMLMASIADS